MTSGDRQDGGDRAGTLDFHQQSLAAVDHVKGIGFGCPAVPATVIDLPLAVPVAQCQVGKSRPARSIRGDAVVSPAVAGPETRHAAVGKPDSHHSLRKIQVIHVGGGIIQHMPVGQRRRQEYGKSLLKVHRRRPEVSMDVVGQFPAKKPIPKPVGAMRVMIARQEMPLDVCEDAHALQGLVERARRESLHVIDVACHQDMSGSVFPRKLSNSGNRPQAGLLEESHGGVIEKAEDLPDLPVGGVDQLDLHEPGRLPGIQSVPARGSLAMAAASTVSATRSSRSRWWTLDLPHALATVVNSMVRVCK